MCGIVAVTGYKKALPLLMNGLEKLEYRGYDSAGLATVKSINGSNKGLITCRKTKGKLKNLYKLIESNSVSGHLGIGHTRWATHGNPESLNAHPHMDIKG